MRQRGFSLVELMVALALTGVVSTSLLVMVRGELIAFETSEQVARTQLSARAGSDLLEGVLRRACAGMANGGLGLNLPGVQAVTSCVRVWDGAVLSAGSFAHGDASSAPDAVEIVYATGSYTVVSAAPVLTATPSVQVADVTPFSVGQYVLVGDYQQADLFRISEISGNTLSLGTLPAPVLSPTTPPLALGVGSLVFVARTVAVYVAPGSTMLMLDPDGMAGTDHADAQPLVDGAVDLQLAVAIDGDGDGIISENSSGAGDEWWGNAPGELPLLPPPPYGAGVGYVQPRQLRASLLVQTNNSYPGAGAALGPYEDRTTYASAASAAPRYRSSRIVIAPRVWNLGE